MSQEPSAQDLYASAAARVGRGRPVSTPAPLPITIALSGLAGTGKDTVADALVTHAGFTKLAFADALRREVAHAFELGDQYGILSARATKELPHERLALGWCTDLEFVRAVNAAAFAGAMPLGELDAPRSPRQIMQWWGTEYRRSQQPNYWSTKVAMHILALREGGAGERVVITDCRFTNEAAAVRAIGGEVWQVFRPGIDIVEGNHASQNDGSNLGAHSVLVNHASVPELVRQTLRLLTKRFGGEVLPIHIQEPAA